MPMNLLRKQKGAILALTAVMLPVLLAFMGLAVDLGNVFAAQAKLQSAADAAVLAGAQVYNISNDQKKAKQKAEDMLQKNIDIKNLSYQDFHSASAGRFSTSYEYYVGYLHEDVPLYFLRFVGKPTYTVEAKAVAIVGITDENHKKDRENAYKLLESVLRKAVQNQADYESSSWWTQMNWNNQRNPRISLPNKNSFVSLLVTKEAGSRQGHDGSASIGVQINGSNYRGFSYLWSDIVNYLDPSLSDLKVQQQNGVTWYGVRLYGDGSAYYFQGYNDSRALTQQTGIATGKNFQGHPLYLNDRQKYFYYGSDGYIYYLDIPLNKQNNNNQIIPENGPYSRDYSLSGDVATFEEDDNVTVTKTVLVDNKLAD